jgi:hypothetical protein
MAHTPRKNLPKAKIKRSTLHPKKRNAAPRTAEQYFAQPERLQEALRRMTDVIAKMRKDRVSLQAAARETGISPRAVKRLAGPAIRKGKNGRYTAKHGDQLLRVLRIPTPEGLREVGIRGSRRASAVGEYSAAVSRYLATGDSGPLSKFSGKGIKDDTGNIVPFLTDRSILNQLGNAGALSFESIYARSA